MSATDFDPQNYGPAVAALLEPRRLHELGPGQPHRTARSHLEALTDEALFGGRRVADAEMAAACRAGLWLYHDFLDRSHEISQEIETPTGSYWHALMHRREPDFANAKYWFHRVCRHAAFQPLADFSRTLAPAPAGFPTQAEWDPFRFVDLCQRAIGTGSSDELFCRQVQGREWELLFDYSFRKSVEERR